MMSKYTPICYTISSVLKGKIDKAPRDVRSENYKFGKRIGLSM